MSQPGSLVVDTSVVVKWFFDEPNTPQALELLAAFRDGRKRALAPDLIYAEFTSAVWKRVVRKTLSVEDGAAIVETFEQLPLEISPPLRLLLPAYRLAVEFGCTTYDALFVALSLQSGADLVTADESLFHAVKRLGKVRLLGEWDRGEQP